MVAVGDPCCRRHKWQAISILELTDAAYAVLRGFGKSALFGSVFGSVSGSSVRERLWVLVSPGSCRVLHLLSRGFSAPGPSTKTRITTPSQSGKPIEGAGAGMVAAPGVGVAELLTAGAGGGVAGMPVVLAGFVDRAAGVASVSVEALGAAAASSATGAFCFRSSPDCFVG